MYFEKKNSAPNIETFKSFKTKNDVFACSCFCLLKDTKKKAQFIHIKNICLFLPSQNFSPEAFFVVQLTHTF